MISREPGQARKGAAAAVISCAGVWLVGLPPNTWFIRLFAVSCAGGTRGGTCRPYPPISSFPVTLSSTAVLRCRNRCVRSLAGARFVVRSIPAVVIKP